MNFNRIDIIKTPGCGEVWQGGSVDADIDTLAGPILIVCMDKGESNEQWINHTSVEAVLAVWIDDSPDACLKDSVLTGLAKTGAAWLTNGGNLYIHCAAGVSRATYYDTSMHCELLGISANAALAAIKADRPVIDPNPGFLAQLQRLWPGS